MIFIIPFAVTLFITPILRKLALRLGVVDLPERRKIHKKATPLFGGMAIYLGVLAGFLLHLGDLRSFAPLLIAATIILIIGLIDDTKGLSTQFRLLCQLLCALIIIASGERITFLPPTLLGDIGEILITLFWIVGVTNAFNYLDGIDGLACGSAAISLFCFTVILYTTGQNYLAMFSIILIAACLGFLPYNFKQAKIFLGDAGSTFLGFILAGISVVGYWAEDNIVKVSIPILVMGVPIFDMIFTTITRIKGEKIKTLLEWLRYGGRDHFHHYLVDLGLRPQGAVIFIYFITLSLGISAIMVSNDRAVEAVLTLSQAAIIFGVIATLIVVGKRRRSGWDLPKKN